MKNSLTRRSFFKKATGIGGGLLSLFGLLPSNGFGQSGRYQPPVVISTWDHGLPANEAAHKTLSGGGTALDAVEAGVMVPEGDPETHSVGYGGYPDEEGIVTLDACIMDWQMRCGSVAALQDIKHPIKVARKVMEITDHIMLVGEGAKTFALRTGFQEENLLTDEAREWWLNWKRNLSNHDDWLLPEDTHDTIGMLALDDQGRVAGACTTSGLSGKIHGRVGDSPIIGAGLYVDGKIGGATATGRGEEVIRTSGSHLVVENMRHGMSPQEACENALRRIMQIYGDGIQFQVAYLALNVEGEIGAASLQSGFQYALYGAGKNALYEGSYLL
ncbi:MAG TPA: N(4)-(beta-N-acetylglucosaminyl)-L-asparaginase [bacterium]|nr:N(4)-(beta-N-acetylglucosaminyl)-L-asparaginase [bacterium]